MEQLSLFDLPQDYIVNVSRVSQRSPFRYPGGKTWLIPRIHNWLGRKDPKPVELIEPFSGGAIVGLTAAFENLVEHVTLVELDDQVAAVWENIITQGRGDWLAKKIEEFDLTVENVNAVLSIEDPALPEKAFQTILQNRVSHGGILAKGAGLIKNGEAGRGISSRWYPQTLAKRIRDIQAIRNKLTFIHGDAFDIINANRDRTDIVFFIDPPYTAGNGKRAGARLYNHFEVDHERIFALMEQVRGDFLITYDNDEYVREMAARHHFQFAPIAMTNTHHAEMNELLIGRDLTWFAK